MKNLLNFLLEIGKLKNIKRKGITFYGVKNPDSTTDHTFRTAMLVWLLGKERNIRLEKALKMALIHDISKIYAGDITPYDGFLPKNKKERGEFTRKWCRLSLNEKKSRFKSKIKKEYRAFKKLISKLPEKIKKEMMNLWFDYHKLKSSEAKLVFQLDMTENLLEALEWYKKNKKFPTRPWWEHAEEVIDEPNLLKFLKEIEKEEFKK